MSTVRFYAFTLCATWVTALTFSASAATHVAQDPSTVAANAASESCINALLPRETLAELAALPRAADDRAVTALEREARGQDLDSRLAAVLAAARVRGVELGIDALWAAVTGVGHIAPSVLPVLPDSRNSSVPEYDVLGNGHDLQQVLLNVAKTRVALSGLIAGIERGFGESFQFKTVPGNPNHGILEPFEIQVTPVTQGQLIVWRYATGALDPKHLPVDRGMLNDGSTDHIDLGDGITMNYDHPAESMSYLEAEAMAQWLTDLPASKAAGCGYSVITELQYLHALHWAFGVEWDGTHDVTFLTNKIMKAHCVYEGNRKGAHTMAVSERKPSPQGLRHMVGNVYTWTKTEYNLTSGASNRVILGGGYNLDVRYLHLWFRNSVSPELHFLNVGARLVRHCL